ncbi:hypothetical protein [Shewanella marisflavi]|uniref:Uncharacterized protein n=1 Tax=Shewanella marisflavi TaxID=260364 RepID=A0AAC9TXN9_9GAMM|nr:hypothetical protein [Shewanella marisflavi]ASJ95522.1 hypothetical protein CFF01_02370 [Shewanella marisflavi]
MGIITKISLPLIAAFALTACDQEQQSTPEQTKAPAEQTKAPVEQVAPKAERPSADELTAVPNGLSAEQPHSPDKGINMTQGTVRYFNLEGGFWGIITDDGRQILPQNLAQEYRKDGLRLSFKAQEVKDMMTIQQWGVLSTLSDIEIIGQVESKSSDPLL